MKCTPPFKDTKSNALSHMITAKAIDENYTIIDLPKFRVENSFLTNQALEDYGVDKGRMFSEGWDHSGTKSRYTARVNMDVALAVDKVKYWGKEISEEEIIMQRNIAEAKAKLQEEADRLGVPYDETGNYYGSKEISYEETPQIKQGVPELFESNPELANQVYSKILANSRISGENLLSLLLKDNIVEKQCS